MCLYGRGARCVCKIECMCVPTIQVLRSCWDLSQKAVMKIRNSVLAADSTANAGNAVLAQTTSRCRLLLACQPACATRAADANVSRNLVIRFLCDDKPCSMHALRHGLLASAVRCAMRSWGLGRLACAMEEDPAASSAALLCSNMTRALLELTGGKLGSGPHISASRARDRSAREIQVPSFLNITGMGYVCVHARLCVYVCARTRMHALGGRHCVDEVYCVCRTLLNGLPGAGTELEAATTTAYFGIFSRLVSFVASVSSSPAGVHSSAIVTPLLEALCCVAHDGAHGSANFESMLESTNVVPTLIQAAVTFAELEPAATRPAEPRVKAQKDAAPSSAAAASTAWPVALPQPVPGAVRCGGAEQQNFARALMCKFG